MLIKAVESYLQIRRAAGFELRHSGILLRSFARFASERNETHLKARTALEWARLAPSAGGRARRLKSVIRFARHVRLEDDRHEIPPDSAFGHHRQRQVPFIFSPTDIGRLIEQALRLGPVGSLRPHTYSTLFALLAATGLRISEALALRLDDITPEGLLVRKTKFRKSRLVPLHETVAVGLERYLARRCALPGSDDHLFVSLRGCGLHYETVRTVFHRLVGAAGLQRGPHQRIPHIHALRHTFAVRALENCPNEPHQADRHILALSTYMGHAHLADTYWYLEATPQLLGDITSAWDIFVKGQTQ